MEYVLNDCTFPQITWVYFADASNRTPWVPVYAGRTCGLFGWAEVLTVRSRQTPTLHNGHVLEGRWFAPHPCRKWRRSWRYFSVIICGYGQVLTCSTRLSRISCRVYLSIPSHWVHQQAHQQTANRKRPTQRYLDPSNPSLTTHWKVCSPCSQAIALLRLYFAGSQSKREGHRRDLSCQLGWHRKR